GRGDRRGVPRRRPLRVAGLGTERAVGAGLLRAPPASGNVKRAPASCAPRCADGGWRHAGSSTGAADGGGPRKRAWASTPRTCSLRCRAIDVAVSMGEELSMTHHASDRSVSRRIALAGLGAGGLGVALSAATRPAGAQDATAEMANHPLVGT